MNTIYFDNAATTTLDPEVLEAMKPYLLQHYGNPSSIHSLGRITRSAIEKARRKVAELLNAPPAEIFFTSGGTESDNAVLKSWVIDHGVKRVISSPLEHHAVLHPLETMARRGMISLVSVQHDLQGKIDLDQLQQLLQDNQSTLVSLMHGNNEIGNLNPVEEIGRICKDQGALFHCDMVQTIGHFPVDLQKLPVDAAAASAHKFHGPKGVGILYVRGDHQIQPLIEGGSQERNIRAGTENVAAIVGLAKALELAVETMDADRDIILALKLRMMEQLQEKIGGVQFNGLSGDPEHSLYTVLNVSLPERVDAEMLVFNLDIARICASAGSACTSGSNVGSHVLMALDPENPRPSVRFSFSKYNTEEEVDYTVEVLRKLVAGSS